MFPQISLFAYDNLFYSSIKMTPYDSQFGRPPVYVVIMNSQLPSNTRIKDVADLTKALQRSDEYVSDNATANKDRQSW